MPILDTPVGPIAYDREGSGPPVVLVAGAFQFRGFDPDTRELAAELGRRGLTAVNYDRPGRGDSPGEPPFTLAGEVAVLRAFAAELGPVALYGSSSGAAISLAAAAAGVPVTRLVLWEAPVGDDAADSAAADLAGLRAELATGDAERAVLYFMKDMPAEWREGARQGPAWPTMCALAPSLEPDVESIAWTQSGPSRRELLAGVTAPTLVLLGERTLPMFPPAADALAAALPDARQARVAAADHRWELPALADALTGFLLPG